MELGSWKEGLNVENTMEWREGRKAGKMRLPSYGLVERNSVCIYNYTITKRSFFLVTDFTESTYDIAVISELFHMQPAVTEGVSEK